MTKSTPYTQSGQALANQQQAANTASARVKSHKAFLDARLAQLAKWVTSGIRPEALVRWALLDLQTNERLAECPPLQIYMGLLACATAGLEPGALKQHAFLVPFRDRKQGITVCQYIPGWRGMIVQARRSREVRGVHANVVYEAELPTFDIDTGSNPYVKHKPCLTGDRGDIVGAYATADMAQGKPEIEWMGREDLDQIKKMATSRSASPAWSDWEDQMMRKAPIRRLAKRLPMGQDYHVSQAIADAHATEDYSKGIDILDVVTDGAASEALGQAAKAPPVPRTDTAGGPITDDEAAQILAQEREHGE